MKQKIAEMFRKWGVRDTVPLVMLAVAVGLLGLVIFGPTPTWQKRMAECQDVKHGVYLRAEGVCMDVRRIPLSE